MSVTPSRRGSLRNSGEARGACWGCFASGPQAAGRITPVDKRQSEEFVVEAGQTGGARDGELVEAELLPGKRFGLAQARIVDRLGDPSEPRAISLIAIHEQGIPVEFPALRLVVEARSGQTADGKGQIAAREDLRRIWI